MQAWWHHWRLMAKLIQPGLFLPMWADKTHWGFSGEDLGHPSSDALQGGTWSQDPAWGPVFRKGVVLRTHCAALYWDKGRKERKWCDRPALLHPSLYYEIWSDLSHFSASSGMQYSNTVITVLYKFEVLYLHIFILYYFVQIREKSKIQTNRPSLIFSVNYTVWMCWIFPFCLCKAWTVMQQAWTLVHYYTAPLVTSLWYSLTTPFLLWNTCWQYGNADITDACAHCFIYQEWPQCHWNE